MGGQSNCTLPDGAKRIVVCLDGTSNSTEAIAHRAASNVLLFARAMRHHDDDRHLQIVNYIPGVGSEEAAGGLGRLKNKAIGAGFSQTVKEAYEFLSLNYAFHDKIYIVGFSRGAAAARSLSGLTELFGIIPKHLMHHFDRAWAFYKTPPSKRKAALDELRVHSTELANIATVGGALRRAHMGETADAEPDDFEPYGHAPEFVIRSPHEPGASPHDPPANVALFLARAGSAYVPLPLHFVGVWDTVYKIPSWAGFHESRLAWNVGRAYQALAIHEIRGAFKPTLWRAACSHQTVVQTWFPGAHSDVGGGLPGRGLSSAALRWMVDKAKADGLVFDERYLVGVLQPDISQRVWEPRGWPPPYYTRSIRRPQFRHDSVSPSVTDDRWRHVSWPKRSHFLGADQRAGRLLLEPVGQLAACALDAEQRLSELEKQVNAAADSICDAGGRLLTLPDPTRGPDWPVFESSRRTLEQKHNEVTALLATLQSKVAARQAESDSWAAEWEAREVTCQTVSRIEQADLRVRARVAEADAKANEVVQHHRLRLLHWKRPLHPRDSL